MQQFASAIGHARKAQLPVDVRPSTAEREVIAGGTEGRRGRKAGRGFDGLWRTALKRNHPGARKVGSDEQGVVGRAEGPGVDDVLFGGFKDHLGGKSGFVDIEKVEPTIPIQGKPPAGGIEHDAMPFSGGFERQWQDRGSAGGFRVEGNLIGACVFGPEGVPVSRRIRHRIFRDAVRKEGKGKRVLRPHQVIGGGIGKRARPPRKNEGGGGVEDGGTP